MLENIQLKEIAIYRRCTVKLASRASAGFLLVGWLGQRLTIVTTAVNLLLQSQ